MFITVAEETQARPKRGSAQETPRMGSRTNEANSDRPSHPEGLTRPGGTMTN